MKFSDICKLYRTEGGHFRAPECIRVTVNGEAAVFHRYVRPDNSKAIRWESWGHMTIPDNPVIHGAEVKAIQLAEQGGLLVTLALDVQE